jgi:hypothetical protein
MSIVSCLFLFIQEVFVKGKGGAALGLILIVIGFILFGTLLTSIDSWAYAETSTVRTIITGGNTTGVMSLGSPLYDENLDNVVTLASSLATDDPAPYAYTDTGDVLTVSGLTASNTRTITATYQTERTDSVLSTLQPFIPFFVLLMFLAAGGGLIWSSVR